MSTTPEEHAVEDGRMTIWEHLAELRSRLIKCCIAIVAGAVIGWIVYPAVLDFLRQPYCNIQPDSCEFLALDPLEPFAIRLKVSAFIGIVIAMPVLLWQVWRFVTPGLYPHEKKYAIPFVVSSMALFLFGATLAYYTLTPALEFLIDLGGGNIHSQYSPSSYITLLLYMMLAFGAGFEVPVLLVALQMIGVLKPRQLLGWWRPAIVVIAIVAAVITPSGDPISMSALMFPMIILYFGAIGVGAIFYRRKRKKEQRAAANTGT
jgi:sec-independent protein translocase protein TatC